MNEPTGIVEKVELEETELVNYVEDQDERAIVKEEMTGELVQAFVYLSKDNKPVLSYAGIKEMARRHKNITYGVSKVDVCDSHVIAYGFAHNLSDNVKAEIPNLQKCVDAKGNVDTYAFQKACSKATRNSIKAVLAYEEVEAVIKKFMETVPVRGPVKFNGTSEEEKAITSPQIQVIEIFFKDAGLLAEDIHRLFGVDHVAQITQKQFSVFADDCCMAAGRKEAPKSFREYESAERGKILSMLRMKSGK